MRFGIDLGGTKIELVALDKANQLVWRQRVATPKQDYPATLAAMVDLVEQAQVQLNLSTPASVGVGIPGAISAKTGRVKNANSTWLIGQDLQQDLEHRLARPVRIANDANCFALSEARQGAAQGAQSVFGVILGTGCGGGLVYRGEILSGVNAIGGEWGHNPMPWKNKHDASVSCYCGQEDCIETFLSGTGLADRYQRRYHQALSVEAIVENMRKGEPAAVELMMNYYDWLAKGLASVINVFDPEVIVLGGGLSQIDELYTLVPKRWSQWVFSDQVLTQLKPPMFGDSSGVIGAAWLWGEAQDVNV